MTELINEKTLGEYEDFVKSHPKGHFMQSRLWGYQKPEWEWAAVAVRGGDGKIKGSCSALIRTLPGIPWRLMYCGRGPVCDIHDRETLKELTDAIGVLAKKHRAYAVKMDPDVPADDAEFWNIMKELGFKLPEAGKNFEGIQPRFVFRLYPNGRAKEEMLASFESKWRYNIRLSQRKGVTVVSEGKKACSEFAALMLDTGVRDGFVTRKQDYFENMLDNLGEHARLYMARANGEAIAGTLAIAYGDKVWYLYGASSNEKRNLMPNYLLQWEMICWALELGARVYDFRGVSGDISEDNPLYGLYRFKKGFGGEFTEFGGELELLNNKFAAAAVKTSTKIFMAARRTAYLMKNSKRREREDEPKPKN